jgi:DNA (cytosine-5)-methyltransferase 1
MGIHSRPTNGLSLCAGAGGLDLGLMLAEPGFHTRVWVEFEEYPRQAIIAGQRAGYFAPAPIWDDLKTFDGRPYRGHIDTVLAGYPCQPFSAAGQRRGADDPRHLWPDVARVIREIEPEWVFLENVAGHISLGLESVLRELWDMGYAPAAGAFSAAETGATHERLRVFIVAHRNGCDGDWRGGRGAGRRAEPAIGGGSMADPDGRHAGAKREQRGGQQRLLAAGGGTGATDVVHAERAERVQDAQGWHVANGDHTGRDQASGRAGESVTPLDDPSSPRRDGARIGPSADSQGRERLSGDGCAELVNTPSLGRGEGQPQPSLRSGRDTVASTGGAMADARGEGLEGREQPGSLGERDRPPAHGSTAERSSPRLFPPGPADTEGWADALATAPDLAPAAGLADCLAWAGHLAQALEGTEQAQAQSRLRLMADGLAARSRALRLLGNGVHPLAAGYAWRSLANAHGLRALDLEASDRTTGASATDGFVLRAAE